MASARSGKSWPVRLDIGILCANSPQAKGRVERADKTLQDRLAKEPRLRGVATIDAANAVLRGFVADHNARFAKAPRSPNDLHRPLSARDDVDAALAWREERTGSNSLTLRPWRTNHGPWLRRDQGPAGPGV